MSEPDLLWSIKMYSSAQVHPRLLTSVTNGLTRSIIRTMSLIVLFYNLRVRNPICLLSNPIAGQRHQGCIIMSEHQDKQNYSQALYVIMGCQMHFSERTAPHNLLRIFAVVPIRGNISRERMKEWKGEKVMWNNCVWWRLLENPAKINHLIHVFFFAGPKWSTSLDQLMTF